jgi:hypothetical protein
MDTDKKLGRIIRLWVSDVHFRSANDREKADHLIGPADSGVLKATAAFAYSEQTEPSHSDTLPSVASL